ncbi:MAG: hypothetical protein ABI907_14330, partial [Ramlibacter sp.]
RSCLSACVPTGAQRARRAEPAASMSSTAARLAHKRASALTRRMGELLLSRAFDLDAGLLVMGCYGHSRVRLARGAQS